MGDNREIGKELYIMSLLFDKNKLLKGEMLETELNNEAKRWGLSAQESRRPMYAVAIVKGEDTEEAYRDISGLLSIGEGIFGKKFNCGGLYTGGKLVYLISGEREDVRTQLSYLASELIQRFERTMHARCSIGISKAAGTLTECEKAYEEAEFAIKYLPDRAGGVYFVEDIVASMELDHNRLGYIVSKFESHLKMSDRAGLEKYLNEIFSKKEIQSMSRSNLDMLFIQMTYCIHKAVYDVSDSQEADRFLVSQMVKPKILEKREDIYRLSMEAKDIMSKQRKQNSEVICDRAMHIIETEYGDETMSLASISERLHVSSSYLSAILRKNRGDTFVNLLTGKRMTAAKEYLMCTSMKIMEIAQRCGYSDQHYFSYCFKRYYGTSPNKIRKSGSDEAQTGRNEAVAENKENQDLV